ncbi:MAG: hypothetical protein ATN35_03935 [Epulopiscium sp. Nele67-Bin004]|nr:MAG: hypothetical protein ATN35_03935 [Epulopiscium sp. Nele67-Bin004]
MDRRWTLHIEDFGKVKEADIEISPLMCFVGDNNTGKSYIMSLLWGILTFGTNMFYGGQKSETYNSCETWLKNIINKDVVIDKQAMQLYVNWFNELLEDNKKGLVNEIFNFDMTIGKLEIQNYNCTSDICIKWIKNKNELEAGKNNILFVNDKLFSEQNYYAINSIICWNIIGWELTASLNRAPVSLRQGEPIYFPASRTGFMLTYSQLLDSSIRNNFSPMSEKRKAILAAPYVDFLSLIAQFESQDDDNKYTDIINFIEQEMLNGTLSAKNEYAPVIEFVPNGVDKEIPLYVTSSVVAEVSPILLTLKSDIAFKTLIIEEPEAHLHPALQQKMAMLIIRLMNSGIPIWITTHNEIILQHINNMIKLTNNKSKQQLMQQYGYTEKDLLKTSDIQLYQFTNEANTTNIEKLESGDYGFVVPTFNNALTAVMEEVYAFEEEENV